MTRDVDRVRESEFDLRHTSRSLPPVRARDSVRAQEIELRACVGWPRLDSHPRKSSQCSFR
jgi:hypothetical protein